MDVCFTFAIEKPLHAKEGSMMRELLRIVCQLRAKIDVLKEDGGDSGDNMLSFLTILIVIVGIYFGQGGGTNF